MTLRIPDDEVSRPSIEERVRPPGVVGPPAARGLDAAVGRAGRDARADADHARSTRTRPSRSGRRRRSRAASRPPRSRWSAAAEDSWDALPADRGGRPHRAAAARRRARAPLPSDDLVIPIHDEIHDALQLVEDPSRRPSRRRSRSSRRTSSRRHLHPGAPAARARRSRRRGHSASTTTSPRPPCSPPTPRMEGALTNSSGAGRYRMSDPGGGDHPRGSRRCRGGVPLRPRRPRACRRCVRTPCSRSPRRRRASTAGASSRFRR